MIVNAVSRISEELNMKAKTLTLYNFIIEGTASPDSERIKSWPYNHRGWMMKIKSYLKILRGLL